MDFFDNFFFLSFHVILPRVSYLEVVDLHEGFVGVEGMFNGRRARLTDLTGVFHVGSAEGKTEQENKRYTQ